jgi:hypothetical protein
MPEETVSRPAGEKAGQAGRKSETGAASYTSIFLAKKLQNRRALDVMSIQPRIVASRSKPARRCEQRSNRARTLQTYDLADMLREL